MDTLKILMFFSLVGSISIGISYALVKYFLDLCDPEFRKKFSFYLVLSSCFIFIFVVALIKLAKAIVDENNFPMLIAGFIGLSLLSMYLRSYVYIYPMSEKDSNKRYSIVTLITYIGIIISMPYVMLCFVE